MHLATYLAKWPFLISDLTTTNHKSVPVIPRIFTDFWSLLWVGGQIPTFFFLLAKSSKITLFYGLMDLAHLFDQIKSWSLLWVARFTRPI